MATNLGEDPVKSKYGLAMLCDYLSVLGGAMATHGLFNVPNPSAAITSGLIGIAWCGFCFYESSTKNPSLYFLQSSLRSQENRTLSNLSPIRTQLGTDYKERMPLLIMGALSTAFTIGLNWCVESGLLVPQSNYDPNIMNQILVGGQIVMYTQSLKCYFRSCEIDLDDAAPGG